MRRLSSLLIAVCLFAVPAAHLAAQWAPLATDPAAQQRLEWWRAARFGLFIHWGLYAIPARGEWVQWNEQIPVAQYAELMREFKPAKFDADKWAAIAKDAGMKYVVLTARHHDGFALFDDPGNSFTALGSAAHRDFVADYVEAVRHAGLRVGLYYSPLDWRFPGFFFPDLYLDNAVALREQYRRQVSQLASHYGKLDILWFDGGGNEWLGFGGVHFHGRWDARPAGEPYHGRFDWHDAQIIAELRERQPDILINDRTNAPADFRSREGDVALGQFDNHTPFELCTTIVDGAWGYQEGARVKPLADLLRLLVGAAGRDGNFLLNVGPGADGEIDPSQVARLHEIGAWLKANGESIYGTRGGPWLPGDYGVSTHTGKFIYLHVLQTPKSGTLELPALPIRVTKMTDMSGNAVAYAQNQRHLSITMPVRTNSIDFIVKLALAAPWDSNAVLPAQPDSGPLTSRSPSEQLH